VELLSGIAHAERSMSSQKGKRLSKWALRKLPGVRALDNHTFLPTQIRWSDTETA
jgi:hypothetical protein